MIVSRRELLELAGATVTAAAVGTAGCLTVTAQEEVDEPPAYSRWLTIDDGGLEFVRVDWAALEEFVGDELEEADPDEEVPEEFRADPMIAPVSDGLLRAYFFVGLDLAQYRLGRLLDVDDEFESTVEGLLLIDDAFVVTGIIDPAEIDARLTAEPEAEFIRQLERTDEIGGFDVYTPVEADVDAAIAVDSDALVVVDGEDGEPTATLETTIGASTGDVERATDESEAFEWVVSSAGAGDVAVGQYGPAAGAQPNDAGLVDFAFEGLEDAEAIVSSLAVEDEDTSTGDFAAVVDDPDEAALEELLGASGDEQSVDVDGDRVTATATWEEESLTTD